ncbi:hypothetical protein B0H67DRAFT_523877, partial [Lasiosphaeris hirsuta]
MQRKMLKEYPEKGYQESFSQALTRFPKDVGFNNGLSAARPDFVQGLVQQEFQHIAVNNIPGAVIHKDKRYPTTLPHIGGEWKKSGGDLKMAETQAGYDGAAFVYARNQALKEMGEADPAGHANVTTFTSDGRTLDIYTHHATPSKGGDNNLQHHQHRVATADLTNSYQGFRDGYRMLRNAQDHARAQSYRLRDRLDNH